MNRTTIDGRYALERPLGSGGMAEVFLAHDGVLDRDVALKVLRSQYAGDEEFYERFRREARSAASLSHPNIVSIFDRGESESGTSYIAMEHVSGGTLKERLDEKGPLDPGRALAATAQVAEALWTAHDRGVIHRDIKPQNILITDTGHLKVTDFGIARAASAATISATNAVFGTAGYLSPEQALGEPATPRSDIYSLGIVLYEMLTGVVPYRADNPVAVCMKHVTEPLRPPRTIDPTIPGAVDALVVKMLAKDPTDRPASASALLDDIEDARRGISPAAPARVPGTPRVGVRKNTAAATTVAAPAAGTTGTRRLQGGPQRGQPAGRRTRRRRAAVLISCTLLALLGAASLALSGESGRDGMPMDRLQAVAGGGLVAPITAAGGTGDAGGADAGGTGDPGTPEPPPVETPAPPPASTPPASVPPAGSAPSGDQYDGG